MIMQKVALLSYQYWYNYGTCLQSYALWKYLETQGFPAEYLNFDWKYPVSLESHYAYFWEYKIPHHRLLGKIKYRLLSYYKALKEHDILFQFLKDFIYFNNSRKFDAFYKKFIRVSPPVSSVDLHGIENDYRKFIIGSDQVWNPDCCEEKYFLHFLLDFVHDKKKKVAYAPSIGKTELDARTTDLFVKYLKDFEYISCREETGCEILRSILSKEITQVIDPTLLLSPAEWMKIAKYPARTEDAVICYVLGDKECIVKFAQNIAHAIQKNIIIITNSYSIIRKYGKMVAYGIGPREFIGLLDKCACFVTDSFHGTIFSINFNKPFFSFMKRQGGYTTSDNSRIVDVLKHFHLEEQFREDDNMAFSLDVDFMEANKILNRERHKSIQYLIRALE